MKEAYWKILNTLRETRNITKTAEMLYMTQPTLTKKLQQMEAEFGVQIAIRGARGIILTPEGEYLAGESGRMLRELELIRDNLLRISGGDGGTIALGVNNSFGRYTLPTLLRQYRDTHPNINFEIKAMLSSQIFDAVNSREVHVGFVRGESAYDFDGYMHLLGVDQMLAAARDPFRLEDLPNMTRVCYMIDPPTTKMIDRWWHSHFFVPPKIGINVHNGDVCREMIENGLGYAIFSVPAFIENSPNLFKLPLFKKNGKPLQRSAWIICKHDCYDILLYRSFVDFMIMKINPG